jgi:hypothetical protein
MSPRTRKPPDPRHAEVVAVLRQYWEVERNELVPDLPWTAADAGALGQFLRGNPTLTVDQVKELLRNRLKSDDHARGEPIFVWIKYLTRYAAGPLDKYKQPKLTTERRTDGKPNRTDERNEQAADATRAALDRIRAVAGR